MEGVGKITSRYTSVNKKEEKRFKAAEVKVDNSLATTEKQTDDPVTAVAAIPVTDYILENGRTSATLLGASYTRYGPVVSSKQILCSLLADTKSFLKHAFVVRRHNNRCLLLNNMGCFLLVQSHLLRYPVIRPHGN